MNDVKSDLDKIEVIIELDKSGMHKYLLSEARDTWQSYASIKARKMDTYPVTNIVAAGMGGSGMTPMALEFLFKDEFSVPYVVSQTYDLPKFADSGTLLMAISDSGETEEVISQYYQAKKKKASIIAIGQRSRLIKMAKEDNIQYFDYSTPVPSRGSFAFMFGSAIAYLENLNLIHCDKETGILESIEILAELDKEIGIEIPTEKNMAKKLAVRLKDCLPILYLEPPFGGLGPRFAKMMNENAGLFAFYNHFPELRHNEIMSWVGASDLKSKIVPIFIRDSVEESRMENEIDEIKKLVEIKFDLIELRARGSTKLARFFYLMYLLDMISYYMAISLGKDPSTTLELKELKGNLRKKSLIPFSSDIPSADNPSRLLDPKAKMLSD